MAIYTCIEHRDKEDDLHSYFIRRVNNTEMKKVGFGVHLGTFSHLVSFGEIHRPILELLSQMCCWSTCGRV